MFQTLSFTRSWNGFNTPLVFWKTIYNFVSFDVLPGWRWIASGNFFKLFPRQGFDYSCLQKYLRHCYTQVQNLASGGQLLFLPPLPPLFGQQHWKGGVLGGIGSCPSCGNWQYWLCKSGFWASVSTILQPTVAMEKLVEMAGYSAVKLFTIPYFKSQKKCFFQPA